MTTRALRFELRTGSLKLLILPIKLYSFFYINLNMDFSEKRRFEHLGVKHNIQQISRLTYGNPSLYELGRLRSGIIFLDKETFYQLKLLTLWPVEIESTHFVWKTNSLPLTYGHFLTRYLFIKKDICQLYYLFFFYNYLQLNIRQILFNNI